MYSTLSNCENYTIVYHNNIRIAYCFWYSNSVVFSTERFPEGNGDFTKSWNIDSWHFDHRLQHPWSNYFPSILKAPPRCDSPRHRSSPRYEEAEQPVPAVGNKPTDARTLVVLFLVNFRAIGNALSPISRMTSPLFSPHVAVPFYFFGSRKNVEGGLRSRTLEIRLHAERPRASKTRGCPTSRCERDRRFIVRNGSTSQKFSPYRVTPVAAISCDRGKTIRGREKDLLTSRKRRTLSRPSAGGPPRRWWLGQCFATTGLYDRRRRSSGKRKRGPSLEYRLFCENNEI